jgi:hypothetical protein
MFNLLRVRVPHGDDAPPAVPLGPDHRDRPAIEQPVGDVPLFAIGEPQVGLGESLSIEHPPGIGEIQPTFRKRRRRLSGSKLISTALCSYGR